jgi:hypothetical protein
MRNQKGYVAGYNGQLVVTAQQVIAGTMLSQHPVGRTLLHPLLDTCRRQLAEAGIRPKLRTVLAGSGYVSEESFARAGAGGLRLLAPLAKDPGRRRVRTSQRARHLDQFPATARARRRLQHPRGREDYRMRARTVEPVVGQLKTCQKNDHDVPARPSRVRKRMAARLRCAQPAQAAPAPNGALTVHRTIPDSQGFKITKTVVSHSVSAFQDLQPVLRTALCDRLQYASLKPTVIGRWMPFAWQCRSLGLPRSVQRLDRCDRHQVLHGIGELPVERDQRVGVKLGQGDVLGVKGVRPPEQDCRLPCDVLKDAIPEQPDPEPAHVVELSLGILPGHLAAAYCLVEKRQHLRAKKRRGQDLMFAADHGLVAGQANGDVWADHVPGHGRSVLLRCCATRAPAHSTKMPGPLIGTAGRFSGLEPTRDDRFDQVPEAM